MQKLSLFHTAFEPQKLLTFYLPIYHPSIIRPRIQNPEKFDEFVICMIYIVLLMINTRMVNQLEDILW